MSTGIDFSQLKPDFSALLPFRHEAQPYHHLQNQFVEAFRFFCKQSEQRFMLVQAPLFCQPKPLFAEIFEPEAKLPTRLREQRQGFYSGSASAESDKVWNFDEQTTTACIIAEQFTEQTLFGQIPSRLENGSLIADISRYRPGQIALANKGIWVIYARDILENPTLWKQLASCAQSGYLLPSQLIGEQTCGDTFDAIPVDLKMVIWGDSQEQEILLEQFPSLWYQSAVKSELNEEIKADQAGVNAWLSALLAGNQFALCEDVALQQHLLRLASRRSEHNHYLALDFAPIKQMIIHAHQQHSTLTCEAFQKTFQQHQQFRNGEWRWSRRSYVDQQINIKLNGAELGQINGLSVLESPGLSRTFGEPMRITATVHLGDGDLNDVERKAELAGNIHAKSMMIIQGYLSKQFARDGHFPLAGTVVFEQSYHEIDGDSASLASLIAILSSLARQPIDQSFATTGAIDQLGNVLAVGGINEKIEGFYQISQLIDPDNHHSVIMPKANLLQLNLSDEICKAVKTERFRIYPVETVEQAIELLFHHEAGSAQSKTGLLGHINKRAQAYYQAEEDDENSSRWFKWLKKRG